jgi:hypothetical protein
MITLRRALINALDKPGGRRRLSDLATPYARTLVPENISIFHGDIWIRGEFRTRDVLIDFLRKHDFQIVTRGADPRPYVRDHICGARSGI